MEIRKDVMGIIPKIGDIIAFTPPRYRNGQLYVGEVVSFTKTGLPEVIPTEYIGQINNSGGYSPKKGFVVCNSLKFN